MILDKSTIIDTIKKLYLNYCIENRGKWPDTCSISYDLYLFLENGNDKVINPHQPIEKVCGMNVEIEYESHGTISVYEYDELYGTIDAVNKIREWINDKNKN